MTDITRRSLLGTGAVVAAGTALGLTAPAATAATTTAIAKRSMFSPLVGTTLRLARGGTTYKATLSAVYDLLPKQAGADEDQFRLALTSSDARVTEGIYQVSSPKLTAVNLFLSPVGPVQSKLSLQAIVYRRV